MSNRHKYLVAPIVLLIVVMTVGMSWGGQQTQAAGDQSVDGVVIGSNAPDPAELQLRLAEDRQYQEQFDQQLHDFYQGIADAQVAEYLGALEAQHQEQLRVEAAKAAKAAQVTQAGPRTTGGGTPPNSFLACVRQRESGGDYGAVNRSSMAGGAYQFLPSTARIVAGWMGRSDLMGVGAQNWSTADQDSGAALLYERMGRSPWAGDGC